MRTHAWRIVGLVAALALSPRCGGARVTPPAPLATLPPSTSAAPAPAPPPPPPLPTTAAEICALPRTLVADALAGARPFTREDPHDDHADPFDARSPKGPPGDLCFVADDNLARAERESRVAPTRTAAGVPAGSAPARGTIRYLDRITSHLHLNDAELAALRKDGFVALDRLERESYATAYHDVFQQELPLYVSVDAVLNSVFQSNGILLEHVERSDLQPRLGRLLGKLRKTLARSVARYGRETADDLDLYLGVATELSGAAATDPPVWSLFGHEDAVEAVLQSVRSDEPGLRRVHLFGRDRMVDFSQLTPRGHYAGGYNGLTAQPGLDGYFRSMMWLSRLEWNLASRSCRSSAPDAPDPAETPREARDAMALADLASRAGALEDLGAFDRVYTVFAGRREDVSVPDLLRLMATARIAPGAADGPERLRAAIGQGFARTARVHFMPEGSTTLPVIATLFGPRVVPDTAPLTRVVHDSVPERKGLGAADVAYVLGHDRALAYLKGDLGGFPALRGALDGARAELQRGLAGKTDLYSLWMTAVARLADLPRGTVPSFMRSDAYRDLAMNSALVGYGQIRHNFVLVAAQGYDSYGCEIPDGYVEPAVGTYDALIAYARAARAWDVKEGAYWRRVLDVLGMLRGIAVTELAGAPLSVAQRRWLGMVAEYVPTGGYGGDSGAPPKWTGWYFDLFPDRHHSAERSPAFVADYFTLTNLERVAYLGAERPRLGVFVVDVNGEPRAMVGPVAKGYELKAPIGKRLDDDAAREASGKTAAWLSYLAPDVPVPDVQATSAACDPDEERVVLRSAAAIGDVTVTLLDHHGDPLTPPLAAPVGPAGTLFTFRLTLALRGAAHGVEGMHVRIHDLAASGVGRGPGDLTFGVRAYTQSGENGGPEAPLRHPFLPFGEPATRALFPPMPAPAPL